MKATPKTDEAIQALRQAADIFDLLPMAIDRIKRGERVAAASLAEGAKWRLDSLNACCVTIEDVKREVWECCPDIDSLPKYTEQFAARFEATEIPADIEDLLDDSSEAYKELLSLGLGDVAVNMSLIALRLWLWVEAVRQMVADTGAGDSRMPQLPNVLITKKEQMTFAKAIAMGWMVARPGGGYEWLGTNKKGSKAELSYLCAKVYGYQYTADRGNVGDNVPYEALQTLFGVTRLDRAMQQTFEAKKPQRWRQKIDQIITE